MSTVREVRAKAALGQGTGPDSTASSNNIIVGVFGAAAAYVFGSTSAHAHTHTHIYIYT